jgi:hypothetical protein
MTKTENFLNQLDKLDRKKPFMMSDFHINQGDARNLMVFLSQMAKEQKIGKLAKGLYYFPVISEITGKLIAPSSIYVAEAILKKDNGYLTDISIYNHLDLTTQLSGTIYYAAEMTPVRFKIRNQEFVRLKSQAPVIEENIPCLQLLDAISNVEHIPDQDPDTAVKIIAEHLTKKSGKELVRMIELSRYYPARTRALLGAIIEPISKSLSVTVKKSLNPATKYKMSGRLQLLNKRKFNIYEKKPAAFKQKIVL